MLSSAMKQPIYVFENGKFLQSYGKGLGGTPITIGYDSKNQQYFGFTNKGSSNSGNIFEAISASSNNKYSADILRAVIQPVPIADTTSPKPVSQPTPQPKPLSQSELSGTQFLLDTLTADKQQLQAKENEYHSTLLQIAKQNMHDTAQDKARMDAIDQERMAAIGGPDGMYIPQLVEPIEGCKTTADIDRNIAEYFDDPNNKYANNQIIKCVAQAGEVIEWAGSNLAYGLSHMKGGRETLLVVSTVVGGVVDGVKDVAKSVVKAVLPNDVYEDTAQDYNELPRGAKIATEFVGDCGILGGVNKIAELAGGEVINALKGAAAEGGVLRNVAGASEISTGISENATKPSFVLSKVEHKLPTSEVAIENSYKVIDGVGKPPIKYEGENILFQSREVAKQFGDTPQVQKVAKDFFGSASNKIHESTNTLKYGNFKVTKMENGNIIMEHTAQSNTLGWNKRFIQIIDDKETVLNYFKETINPTGIVTEIKRIK